MMGEATMLAGSVKRAKCGCLALTTVAVLWGTTSTFGQANTDQGIPLDPWQASALRPYGHGQQKGLSADREGWSLSLTASQECPEAASNRCFSFRIENKIDHSTRTFRLANETAQVDAGTIISRERLAILGRTPDLSIVTVIDLPSAREVDRIISSGASLSPNSRYFAYGKFVPAHPGYGWSPSAEYLAYDLEASPEDNRTPPNRARPLEPYDAGWPLYPEGVKNVSGDNIFEGHDVPVHWMASDGFFWLGAADIVAFVDRWQGVSSLVVADVSGGIQRPRVHAYPIDAARVVDLPGCKSKVAPSDFEAWSKDPSVLIHVTDIQVSSQNPRFVRLKFSPQPCLAGTHVDVPLNSATAAAPSGGD